MIEQFLVSHLLFWGEAHEIIKRLRMFHAQPFDYFSCISFKESPLGAEHAFRIQRAAFFNKIESEKLSSTLKLVLFQHFDFFSISRQFVYKFKTIINSIKRRNMNAFGRK